MIDLFTKAEKDRIEAAIFKAEARTSAEIVPCVIDISATYEISYWRGAAFTSMLVVAAVLVLIRFYTGWGLAWLHTPWGVILMALVGALLGALLVRLIPPLRRLLAGEAYIFERVHQRAMRAFLEEEVFSTAGRSGILIFISLFEHRIEVIGDTGVNSRVAPDEWVSILARIREGIMDDKLVDALVDAIRMCGDLLEKSGVAMRVEDTNELANRVRLVRYER